MMTNFKKRFKQYPLPHRNKSKRPRKLEIFDIRLVRVITEQKLAH